MSGTQGFGGGGVIPHRSKVSAKALRQGGAETERKKTGLQPIYQIHWPLIPAWLFSSASPCVTRRSPQDHPIFLPPNLAWPHHGHHKAQSLGGAECPSPSDRHPIPQSEVYRVAYITSHVPLNTAFQNKASHLYCPQTAKTKGQRLWREAEDRRCLVQLGPMSPASRL